MTENEDNQFEMFETENHDGRQNWKRNDPITSKWAGQEVVKDGTVGRNQQKFLALIKAYEGRTGRELEAIADVERGVGAKRLSELERMKLVYKGLPRSCTLSNRMCVTWWPVET
jgi:hypothetical protein